MTQRTANRLTARRVQTIKAPKPGVPHMVADGNSLYLRIGPTGSKSWVFRYRIGNGATKDVGLGGLGPDPARPTVSLEAAREKAWELRRQRAAGLDPIEQRRTAKSTSAKTLTFAECAEEYHATKAPGLAEKTRRQWLSPITAYINPEIGELPVSEVTTPMLISALSRIWKSRYETAKRTRGRVEQVLDWATVQGLRSGDNPAAWSLVGKGLPGLSQAERAADTSFTAMSCREVPAFMAQLRDVDGPAARALEFAILTAARTGEVHGATWSEIDGGARLWTIPGGRMKASRPHVVPLSEAASGCLPLSRDPSAKVFRIGPGAMLNQLRKLDAEAHVHGFRSSFRDWCAEGGVDDRLAEMALAHQLKNATEAAYNRTNLVEQRQPVMEAWGRFCDGAGGENVIPLPRPAALR